MSDAERLRDEFLRAVWAAVRYWQAEDRRPWPERVEGCAFSILNILDNTAANLDGAYMLAGTLDRDAAEPEWLDVAGGAELHALFYKHPAAELARRARGAP